MILRDTIRTLPSGAAVPAGTEVQVYRVFPSELLATVATDANGMFEYSVPGNPGAVRYEVNVGAGKKVHTTTSLMPVGDLDLSGLRPLMHMFLDGVVVNYKDALAVTSDGLSMEVEVAPGVATARGVIYRQDTTETITIPPVTTNPRIDLICVRFYMDAGGAYAGRCELLRKEGVEAVTPTWPGLVQDDSVWDTALAHVRVDPGVMGIALGKVSDQRLICMPYIPDGAITGPQLAAQTVTGGRIKFGDIEAVHLKDRTITQAKLALGSVTTSIIEDGTVTEAKLSTAVQSKLNTSQVVKDFHRVTAKTGIGTVNTQDAKTVTLPAIPMRCKVKLYLRVEGALGTTANGNVFLNVAGVKQTTFAVQADQGVDSSIWAIAVHTTTGATSLALSWGIDMTSGNLNVKDGWIEWDCTGV